MIEEHTPEYRLRRRGLFETYFNVLSILNDHAMPETRVMYTANMSWKPWKKVLAQLKISGLIEGGVRKRSNVYLTPKGKTVYNGLKKYLDMIGVEVTGEAED